MQSRTFPLLLATVIAAGLIATLVYFKLNSPSLTTETPTGVTSPLSGTLPGAEVSPTVPSTSETPMKTSNLNPDLTTDANGLSKATVVLTTTQGVIKYKFYSKDAPNTVKRMVELINKPFYNGLTFHRVVAGFVIQGGDPSGNGTGGSGMRLKAEFNERRHIEGTVAMARSQDPDSADSQFYISLGTHPHLDRSYTVFGQVIEGMDVAKKIKPGDSMTSVVIE